MNKIHMLWITMLAIAAQADTIVLSTSAPGQVRSCFQGTFDGYVSSFDGMTFTVFVPLTGCDSKRRVPANCGLQVVPVENLPIEIRMGFEPGTQALHQKLSKDEVSSINFGGNIHGQCVVPVLGPSKRISELPGVAWIAPTTSSDFFSVASGSSGGDKFGKFYGVDWGSQSLHGEKLETGDEITLMKADFSGPVGGIRIEQSIAFGGAIGLKRYGPQYVILGGRVTDVNDDLVKVKLERIDSMVLRTSLIAEFPSAKIIEVDPLEVTADIVSSGQFDWDALTSPGADVKINPRSMHVVNGKRHIRVHSNARVDGTLIFIKRRR